MRKKGLAWSDTSLSRREFINASGRVGLAAFVASLPLAGCASKRLQFAPIAKSVRDTVIVPPEFTWHKVISWGDPLHRATPEFDPQDRTANMHAAMGDNNDGMALFMHEGRVLLAVNNEYVTAELMFPGDMEEADVEDALRAIGNSVGVTVVELSEQNGQWVPVLDSPWNRRINGTTRMNITGPARGHAWMRTQADPQGTSSLGTWANCGCGRTPWGTYLTCEENFNVSFSASDDTFSPDALMQRYGIRAGGFGFPFYKADERFDISKHPNEPNRAGYVVEIDPTRPDSVPKKRTALGRLKHENAAMVVNGDGRIVVYMGDDERGEYLYRYVSDRAWDPADPASIDDVMDHGNLSVAKFNDGDEPLSGNGKWLSLEPGQNGIDAESGFPSRAEVCINTRSAASLVGATTMDRPEWVVCHPHKAEVYCTLTNNRNRNIRPNAGGDPTPVGGPNPREANQYGQIVRWRPRGGDHASAEFDWDLYVLAGNPAVYPEAGDLRGGSDNVTAENMFNSPDGVAFDAEGGLWIQTDGISSDSGDFAGMGNNQMLVGDPHTGEIKRFLAGPTGCEITGATWSEDNKTLFVGIQHPGEDGEETSNFPDGGESVPRSTIIAIQHRDGLPLLA